MERRTKIEFSYIWFGVFMFYVGGCVSFCIVLSLWVSEYFSLCFDWDIRHVQFKGLHFKRDIDILDYGKRRVSELCYEGHDSCLSITQGLLYTHTHTHTCDSTSFSLPNWQVLNLHSVLFILKFSPSVKQTPGGFSYPSWSGPGNKRTLNSILIMLCLTSALISFYCISRCVQYT